MQHNDTEDGARTDCRRACKYGAGKFASYPTYTYSSPQYKTATKNEGVAVKKR